MPYAMLNYDLRSFTGFLTALFFGFERLDRGCFVNSTREFESQMAASHARSAR